MSLVPLLCGVLLGACALAAAHTVQALPVHEAANIKAIKEGHALFAGARDFKVITRKKDPDMHPCADCHETAESDRTPRELEEPHDNFRLRHGLHGRGEFWCFTCHHLRGDGGLRTLEGERLGFDDAYVICAQCHTKQARDWTFGAHGKRIGQWQGDRTLLNCTVCHYQHKPSLEPRPPQPPPPVRRGLGEPQHRPFIAPPIWERRATAASGE